MSRPQQRGDPVVEPNKVLHARAPTATEAGEMVLRKAQAWIDGFGAQ
jgi:hypothetical protein